MTGGRLGDRKVTVGTPIQIAETAARIMISAIPFVGGPLQEIIDHRSRVKLERLDELVEGMKGDMERLGEGAVRLDYLSTEEFGDLLESVMRRVVHAGDPARRARLRQVLISQMLAPAPASDQELFLDIVADISEKELEILREYSAAHLRPHGRGEQVNLPKQGAFRDAVTYGLDEHQYRYHVQKLMARGLLYDDGVGRWSTRAMQVFEISDLGLAFLKYVEADPR